MILLAAVFVFTVALQQPAPSAPATNPQENLDTAIAEGIRLLEGKEYAKFLAAFGPPAALAKRRDTLAEFAAEFSSRGHADRLLTMLKQLQKQKAKPTLSADGLTATYQLDPRPDGAPAALRWTKVGKFWHIDN